MLLCVLFISGVLAVLSIGFLESFRNDVAAFWLSCIPFVFPFITGVAIAYRKQLANVGLHLALLFATSLTGGAGYGYSIQPVYFERHNCTQVSTDRGSCDKEALVYIYVIAGGIACGFAALGILVTCCTCSSASVCPAWVAAGDLVMGVDKLPFVKIVKL
ncbi:uncharacterized protein LOC101857792 [Aplysia californica]|uniref:Uncharacterized protein LOC101857792 n=1 Tax=Aplysia californica TaxID=6500 RepID=A0ABM0ZZ88_APLCA|nr:uncharacterized protein LOC101857792 [Aplysia californica]